MSNIMNIYELRYIKLKGESKQIALKALKARLTLRPWLQTLLGLLQELEGTMLWIRRTYCDLLYQELNCMPIMLAMPITSIMPIRPHIHCIVGQKKTCECARHRTTQTKCHSRFLLFMTDSVATPSPFHKNDNINII